MAKLTEKHERRRLREERRKRRPKSSAKDMLLGKREHIAPAESLAKGRYKQERLQISSVGLKQATPKPSEHNRDSRMVAGDGRRQAIRGDEPELAGRPRESRRRDKGAKKSKSKKKSKKKKKQKKKSKSRKGSKGAEDYSCSEGEVRLPRRRSRKDRM